MIIVLRPHVTEEEIALVVDHVRELGLTPHVSRGVTRTIIGCIGDEDRLHVELEADGRFRGRCV